MNAIIFPGTEARILQTSLRSPFLLFFTVHLFPLCSLPHSVLVQSIKSCEFDLQSMSWIHQHSHYPVQVIVHRSSSAGHCHLSLMGCSSPPPLLPLPLPRALSNFYQQWGWLKSTRGLPFIAPYITSFLFTLYPISPFSFSNIFPILLGAVRCKQKSTVWGFLGGYGFPDKKGWTQPEQSTFCASVFLSVWHTNLYLEKKSSWHQEVESHALNLVER